MTKHHPLPARRQSLTKDLNLPPPHKSPAELQVRGGGSEAAGTRGLTRHAPVKRGDRHRAALWVSTVSKPFESSNATTFGVPTGMETPGTNALRTPHRPDSRRGNKNTRGLEGGL